MARKPTLRAPRAPRGPRAPRAAACAASASGAAAAPRWMATAAFAVVALLALALAVRLLWWWGDAREAEGFQAPSARLVYVHMHGCGWCERFSPVWDAFVRERAGELARAGVRPEKVEASEPGAKALAVRSFPTVLLLVDGGGGGGARRVEFDGERTADGLAAFLAASGFELGAGRREGFEVRRVGSTPEYLRDARKQSGESGPSEEQVADLKRTAGGIKGAAPMTSARPAGAK